MQLNKETVRTFSKSAHVLFIRDTMTYRVITGVFYDTEYSNTGICIV